MSVIQLPNNWKPRPYQRKVWKYWEDGGRQANLIWHRRAGKDEICLHRTAVAAFERPGTYWHMLPEAAHARKAIWTSINPHTGKRRIDEAFPHALRKTTREQEMFIEFVNGSTWQVGGSDRYNSLVGSSPAGVVFSEWALANPAAWGYVRPMLLENGGWSVFITTPRGHNHAEKMHKAAKNVPGAFAQILTASESGVFTPEQLKGELQALIDEHGPDFGQSLFDQEYFCSFDAAILGSYYGAWITKLKSEGRVRDVAIDPALPVHSAWDLGFSDDTSIWFYQVPYGEVHFIGCYSASGMGIDHYIDYLERYYSERGCKRGAIYLPHDARAKTFASGGKSAEEQLAKAFGWSNIRIVPSLSVQDGIQAAREMLKRSYFDVECEDGLEALAQYQREWDDNKKCFRESPKHDWTSHCFVGETSVLTRHGTHQIMDLPYSGEVMTPCGWKQYENPRITRKAAPLVEVRFVGGHTVKCTPDHLFWTESGWISAESLTKGSKIQSSLTRSRSISMAASIAFGRVSGIFRKAAAACIETFGALRLGRFLMDATFTTKIRTQRTTPLITWSAYRQPSITQSQNSEIPVSLLKPGWPPQTGIDPRKGENGTGSMRQSLKAGKNGSASQSLATIAARYLTRWFVKAGIRKDSATSYAKPLHIESVRPLDEVADVWCITVPDGEWFSLSNGAVVHNCADAFRMAAVAYAEEARTKPKPDPKFPLQQSIDQLIAAQRRKRLSQES